MKLAEDDPIRKLAATDPFLAEIDPTDPVSLQEALETFAKAAKDFGQAHIDAVLQAASLKSGAKIHAVKRDFAKLYSPPVKRDGKTWARDWENESDMLSALRNKFSLYFGKKEVNVIVERGGDGYSLLSSAAAAELARPCRLMIENKNNTTSFKPGLQVYLESQERRVHTAFSVDPRLPKKGAIYSTWMGFALRRGSGSCELILRHVREVVCGGDPLLFMYVMEFLAQMIQEPWRKPGCMMALCGKKGNGKTFLADLMRRIIGPNHSFKVANVRHLLGNFNEHLADALLVQVEELGWAGDKAAEAALKDFVTADMVTIEVKGGAVESRFSMARIILTTNERWALPVTEDERRFLVLDVADPFAHAKGRDERQAMSREYFDKLWAEVDGGGAEAFLCHLMRWKLGSVDLRRPPMTSALARQALQTLDTTGRWLVGAVEDGVFLDGGGAPLGGFIRPAKGARVWTWTGTEGFPKGGEFAMREADLKASLIAAGGKTFGRLTTAELLTRLGEVKPVRRERLHLGGERREWAVVIGNRTEWRDMLAERLGIHVDIKSANEAPLPQREPPPVDGTANIVPFPVAA